MKKLLTLSILAAFLIITGCGEEVSLTAPTDFTIAAANDEVSVVLSWTANPSDEEVDGYYIYFNDAIVDSTENTTYTHDDPQESGYYYVTAYRGDEESEDSDELSTIPEVVDNITLAEINATGNSGLGWDRGDGSPTTYSMQDATNADDIDFYFSDWEAGFDGPDYFFISPDLVETDPGVTWPMSGTWKTTGFTTALTDAFEDVTVLPASGYDNSQEVTTLNATYGVWIADDDYYGMVEVKSINSNTGQFEVRVAFQTVPGLRILEH